MTRLRWDKARFRDDDPGTIVSLPAWEIVPDAWVPPQERDRRKAKRAADDARLLKRSEGIRFKTLIKKHGTHKAMMLGVPREFIEAQIAAKQQARQAELRAQEKRARRAAKHIPSPKLTHS